jgi:hypothetical protein
VSLVANALIALALFVTVSNVVCAVQAFATRQPHRPSQVFLVSLILWLVASPAVTSAHGERAGWLAVAMAFVAEGLAWGVPMALDAWVSARAAQLDGANLAGADLRHRALRGARLQGARLADANLEGADLRDADLTESDLARANLRGALLHGATLDRADLSDADLRESVIYRVSYEGVRTSQGTRWPETLDPYMIPTPSAGANTK